MKITRPNPRSNECLREQEHRLDVDGLNLAPGVEFDLLKRPELERRRCVNEDVASAVAIEDELRRRAYVVRVAQVDDDIGGAVEDDHAVVGASRATIAPPMAPAPPVTTATR
jgi:hypothetical protein